MKRATVAGALVVLAVGTAAATASPDAQAPRPNAVILVAQPQLVGYGSATTLAGGVSTQKQGEKVSILAGPCGQNPSTPAVSLETGSGGTFNAPVKPTVTTLYQARFKNATSGVVAVRVRPAVRLRKVGARRYSVRATAAQSFAGRIAVFQRRRSTGAWTALRRVTLRQVATGAPPTIVSGATFRARVRAGSRVRIVLPQSQVGACYVAGVSNTIRS